MKSPHAFFSLLRALCSEILVSNILIQSLGGQLGGQQRGAICGTRMLYLCRQIESELRSMSYRSCMDLCGCIGRMSLFI